MIKGVFGSWKDFLIFDKWVYVVGSIFMSLREARDQGHSFVEGVDRGVCHRVIISETLEHIDS